MRECGVLEPFSLRSRPWERHALRLRQLVGLGLTDQLDPWALAPVIGLTVVDGSAALKLLTSVEQAHMHGPGKSSWSGGIFPDPLPDGTRLCILNPFHSIRRNKITLMEEISHSYLKHAPTKMLIRSDGLDVRDYDQTCEQEAYGVGAAALVPWSRLFPYVNSGAGQDELADEFDVTVQLIQYRIKITGGYRLWLARKGSLRRR